MLQEAEGHLLVAGEDAGLRHPSVGEAEGAGPAQAQDRVGGGQPQVVLLHGDGGGDQVGQHQHRQDAAAPSGVPLQ